MKSNIFHGLLAIFFFAFNILSGLVWLSELIFHYTTLTFHGLHGIPLLNPMFTENAFLLWFFFVINAVSAYYIIYAETRVK